MLKDWAVASGAVRPPGYADEASAAVAVVQLPYIRSITERSGSESWELSPFWLRSLAGWRAGCTALTFGRSGTYANTHEEKRCV